MGNKVLGAFFGVLTAGMLAACGGGGDAGDMAETPPPAPAPPPAAAEVQLPEGVTQEMVAEGQTLFSGAALCSTCHAGDGTGTALAPNLTDSEWINISEGSFDQIVGVITTGVAQPQQHPAPMPAKGGSQITDDQIRAVAAYVYTLSHGS